MSSAATLALAYALRGWRVIPLHSPSGDACSCGRADCKSVGKHPRTTNGLKDATTDREQIRRWFADMPDANVGIVTGRASGVVVLDVDVDKSGDDTLRELEDAYGALPDTVEAVTGGGGRHIFFAYPDEPIANSAGRLGKGLDIRGDGGYVVAAPSLHRSGHLYMWEASSLPSKTPLAPMPGWILGLLRQAAKAKTSAGSIAGGIAEGSRNATLASLAGSMRRRGMSEAAIEAALIAENQHCAPPLDEAEVRRVARSVARYEPAAMNGHVITIPPLVSDQSDGPTSFPMTDLGNAERLVARHGEKLRFITLSSRWLVWSGTHWRTDDTDQVWRYAKQTVRAIYGEVGETEDDDARRVLVKHARKSESAASMSAMIKLTEKESGIPVVPSDLNREPFALNAVNGTVDLRTGELRAHNPNDLITKIVNARYVPSATAPTWLSFLDEIIPDPDVRAFLQRALGYTLSADYREQCLFFCHGSGSNGKSTLIRTWLDLLGDYAKQAAPDLLMATREERHPTGLADLAGSRFVASVETEDGRELAESLVKQMTGGDKQKARFMRGDFFEFDPTFKLFIAANHKPVIKGTDHAIWRRIHMIPFIVTISEDRKDPELPAKLRAELDGILAWGVEGCREWLKSGLCPPSGVKEATRDYRKEMDVLADFLEESCVFTSSLTDYVTSSGIYAKYVQWCQTNGEKPMSQRGLGLRLQERDCLADRLTGGKRIWRLLKWVTHNEDSDA